MAVIFKIVFSLFDEGITKEVCGFEMGYISFVFGDKDDVYDDLSHQPIMIFLTISELILGLAEYDSSLLASVKSDLDYAFDRMSKII